MSKQVDVAIVGYGPAGQMLALQLGRAGHSVVVVERWPQPYRFPRAIGFDHEVGRIFQDLGLAEQTASISHAGTEVTWFNDAREVIFKASWVGQGPSGWPVVSVFAQPELEEILAAEVTRYPSVEVLRGWTAVSVTQDDDGVDVRIEETRPELRTDQTVRAKFVVGCDGANSFVRECMGSHLIDLGFEASRIVVDVLPKVDLKLGVGMVCSLTRPTSFLLGGIGGRRRWEFTLSADETVEQMDSDEVAWELLAEWGVTPETVTLERRAMYTFRGQWVDRRQAGRLFLAGDAAQRMPPTLGQGLCSAVRDAKALGWRLDMVLSGQADEPLLDSYDPERTAHVASVVRASVELARLVNLTDPEEAHRRDEMLKAALTDPDLLRKVLPGRYRLGPGITSDGDSAAGMLSFQGQVSTPDGRTGLFDDIVGRGFVLIGTAFDPAAHLSQDNREFMQRLGLIAHVSDDGPLRDVDGRYSAWFEAEGYGAALVRPDYHIFGSAKRPDQLNPLVEALRTRLPLSTRIRAAEPKPDGLIPIR